MKSIILAAALALVLIAPIASALTTLDGCDPVCDQHQLEWRAAGETEWQSVGAPVDVVPIDHPDAPPGSFGVPWSGLNETPGNEFRAQAIRGRDSSPWTADDELYVVPEPPVTPTFLSCVFVLGVMRRALA